MPDLNVHDVDAGSINNGSCRQHPVAQHSMCMRRGQPARMRCTITNLPAWHPASSRYPWQVARAVILPGSRRGCCAPRTLSSQSTVVLTDSRRGYSAPRTLSSQHTARAGQTTALCQSTTERCVRTTAAADQTTAPDITTTAEITTGVRAVVWGWQRH
jgi:hypothetical protein